MDQETELAMLEADGISQEEIDTAKNGQVKEHNFPYMVFTAALTKDIVDIVTLGTTGLVTNLLTLPIIYLYVRKNMNFGKRRLYKRLIRKGVGEFIPVWSAVSFWSIFVWRAHQKENTRIGRVLNFIESFAK
ncbi:MAG: hypothetical protein WAP55_00870 [Minisyncoccia bacterium]